MNHLIIMPILLPLLAALLLLLGARRGIRLHRALSLTATGATVLISIALLHSASGGNVEAYALGNWTPPFGIVLVLDRLSALMLMLTALVALFALVYALNGGDRIGKNFHMLFQFQLMGLNGAFLTGDLFNLFVFFEILLLASYGLLLHGGGPERTRAALHYVILNLVGSAFFLIGTGILYGVTGTLNMADMAVRVAAASPESAAVLRAGGLLLLVVFGLKAALLPLYFWLPDAYRAAGAPVAALFAIMTKVGVYAIVRLFTLVFGLEAGGAAMVAAPWLLPVSLATLVLGTFGALASRDLRTLIAYMVIASVGTLLTAVGLFDAKGIAAALFYLIHTTLITAGLFLLADLIGSRRGRAGDRFEPAAPLARPQLVGALFFVGAVAVAGMPPLSGFAGKIMILQAAQESAAMGWVWGVVLGAGLMNLLALSRAGSVLFWSTLPVKPSGGPAPLAELAPVIVLLAFSFLVMGLGKPITVFTAATAEQLIHPSGYIESVLGHLADDALRLAAGG